MNHQVFREAELFQNLLGRWQIERVFPSRRAHNVAEVAWILDGHWLEISMKDTQVPPQYEARVLITFVVADQRYSCHWIDTFGGTVPETLGVGERVGDSIVFLFSEGADQLRNTFTWHKESDTWTDTIDQTDKDGNWIVFCTDTYRGIPSL